MAVDNGATKGLLYLGNFFAEQKDYDTMLIYYGLGANNVEDVKID